MADLYESTTFEAVHAGVLDLLPPPGSSVLDVGAGSGRDAAALAAKGYVVTAVEPSSGLRHEALRRHGASRVVWLDDALPKLARVQGKSFALILVSAVWMHVAPRDRPTAMRHLAELLSRCGHLIISLRIGAEDADRSIRVVDATSVKNEGIQSGLRCVRRIDSKDSLGRDDVSWVTLAFIKG